MIDFSDKTQVISFITILAAIAVLLTLTIIVAVRMRKRLSGVAFAFGMTLAIIVLILSIGACLISIAYKTEFMRVDSAIEGNALAFRYDGKTVFSIPYIGVFFEVVFDRASIEMLLYVATLVDLALLVFLCIRWSLTRNVYNLGEDGEGYYTVGDDEPGAFAASDETEVETEPESETESMPAPETATKTPEIPETLVETSEKPIFAAPAPIEETASDDTDEKIAGGLADALLRLYARRNRGRSRRRYGNKRGQAVSRRNADGKARKRRRARGQQSRADRGRHAAYRFGSPGR